LYICASYSFISFLNSAILKKIYHEPKNFWVYEDIKPLYLQKKINEIHQII